MTIVIDTSALAAVVLGEPDATAIASILAAHAGDLAVSAATIVECEIVLEARQGPSAVHDLNQLLGHLSAEIVAFDAAQASLATAAWRRFGKGRHVAGLNLGDCYSYALAKQLGCPLLFKGKDFAQTDIPSAVE